MKSRHTFILILLLILSDALVINLSYALLQFSNLIDIGESERLSNLMVSALNITWVISSFFTGIYRVRKVQRTHAMFKSTFLTFAIQILLIITGNILFSAGLFDIKALFQILSVELLGLVAVRCFVHLLNNYYLNMDTWKQQIAIVGNGETVNNLKDYFLQNQLTYRLTGLYETCEEVSNKVLFDQLENAIVQNKVDEIYLTQYAENNKILNQLLSVAEQHCVRVKFVGYPSNHDAILDGFVSGKHLLNNSFKHLLFVKLKEPLTRVWNRVLKRLFDIVFSLLVIIFLLSWLTPVISLLILLESKGPVIFSQLRSGRNNLPFFCFKFRSMRVNHDSNKVQASKNDPRITKTGAFIRKTSIDELPQFFNVLIGNMSIVGPRPHMLKHTEEYRNLVDKYMVRHLLKPGITGWAQVNGFRGETKEPAQMLGRVKHDIYYMENWSFMLDLKIILKTVKNAVTGEENAY